MKKFTLLVLLYMGFYGVASQAQDLDGQNYYVKFNGNFEYMMIENDGLRYQNTQQFYMEQYNMLGVEFGKKFRSYDIGVIYREWQVSNTPFGNRQVAYEGEIYIDEVWEIGMVMRKYMKKFRPSFKYSFDVGWSLRSSYLLMQGDKFISDAGSANKVQEHHINMASIEGGLFIQLGSTKVFKKEGLYIDYELEPVYARVTNRGYGLGYFNFSLVFSF